MTALVQQISARHIKAQQYLNVELGLFVSKRVNQRFFMVIAFALLISMVPGGWKATIGALGDAYLSVTVFVAGTLSLVYLVERALKTDLGIVLENHKFWQVPAGALLGAFPGCGGAIIAVTQYTKGYLSFGSVVATLTATMGDAMFLLLAREPQTAISVLLIGVIAGVITGYVIDYFHGSDFLRPQRKISVSAIHESFDGSAVAEYQSSFTQTVNAQKSNDNKGINLTERVWVFLMIPGLFIGVLAAFQIDLDLYFASISTTDAANNPTHWIGVAGAVLAVWMWVKVGNEENKSDCSNSGSCQIKNDSLLQQVINNTNFVTVWVIFAFLAYEIVMIATGADMGKLLSGWGPLLPAMAILVGFIPGCGPQIMVTSMYLSGAVPFSAQLGNAIANDGDALFPAIAVAPKAALLASIYSAIPAIMVAYSWYAIMETV